MYCLEVRDPVEKVFTIPELRLIILSYALEDKIEPKKRTITDSGKIYWMKRGNN